MHHCLDPRQLLFELVLTGWKRLCIKKHMHHIMGLEMLSVRIFNHIRNFACKRKNLNFISYVMFSLLLAYRKLFENLYIVCYLYIVRVVNTQIWEKFLKYNKRNNNWHILLFLYNERNNYFTVDISLMKTLDKYLVKYLSLIHTKLIKYLS